MPYDFILRIMAALILLVHGITGMLNSGINDFGVYLNEIGLAPFGLVLAWLIKLSHSITAICLLIDKWIFYPILLTVFVLIMGIVLVHYKEGWFVVGGGRNGMEFNLLLIAALLQILFNKTEKQKKVDL